MITRKVLFCAIALTVSASFLSASPDSTVSSPDSTVRSPTKTKKQRLKDAYFRTLNAYNTFIGKVTVETTISEVCAMHLNDLQVDRYVNTAIKIRGILKEINKIPGGSYVVIITDQNGKNAHCEPSINDKVLSELGIGDELEITGIIDNIQKDYVQLEMCRYEVLSTYNK